MLYYFLNATAIWLICLIAFDAFLRRESYHSYNRFYLLGTFALGLLMPLYEWRGDSIVYSTGISRPVVERAATVKSTIVSTTDSPVAMGWQQWIILLYIAGVTVSLFLLAKEIAILVRMYRRGDKSKDGVWSIIETGKAHSPFSAFRMVFISSKNDYSKEQLKMILYHEEQHGHAMHFIDLMFMQLAKVVFWFHPLVYVYNNRLLTVHEYQADAAVDKDPKTYGQFLIEQTMLGTAPTLSHSFNRSPIKKRILMLTRNSSALSKSKMLLALPITLVCVLCFSKNVFSDDKRTINGNKVTFKGNVFTMRSYPEDTTIVVDPTNGEETMKITSRAPIPVTMNGNKIYQEYEIDENGSMSPLTGFNTIGTLSSTSIKQAIINEIKEYFVQLPDDNYNLGISNIVLDKNGKIVYYDFEGFYASHTATKIPEDVKKQIDRKIITLVNKLSAQPARFQDKAVIFRIHNKNMYDGITIAKGKITSF